MKTHRNENEPDELESFANELGLFLRRILAILPVIGYGLLIVPLYGVVSASRTGNSFIDLGMTLSAFVAWVLGGRMLMELMTRLFLAVPKKK